MQCRRAGYEHGDGTMGEVFRGAWRDGDRHRAGAIGACSTRRDDRRNDRSHDPEPGAEPGVEPDADRADNEFRCPVVAQAG